MHLRHLLNSLLSWLYLGVTSAHVYSNLELGPKGRALSTVKRSRLQRSLQNKCGVDFIFEHFTTNDSLSRMQFQSLLKAIHIGNDTQNGLRDCNKCMTSDDILSVNGLQNEQYLSRPIFEKICPSLLQQIIAKSCHSKDTYKEPDHSKQKVKSSKAWGYGILSVTIISLASLLGAFVVPFMNKAFYKKLLLFMVSVAVGVLGGSGIFHLIPHAFKLNADQNPSYFWKCSTIVGGIYFFFITENLMKIYIRFSEWKRRKVSKKSINGSLNTVPVFDGCLLATTDIVHHEHALDSVHVSDKNCMHEHGVDSLNMAGDHCINKKNASEYFKDSDSHKGSSIFERVAPVAWMIILGDGLHNFIDGLAIGVSFTNDIFQGISTSLAILCEELPHELGDFAILLNSGMSYKQAIFANFMSACTCYIGMIIGTILGSTTHIVTWIYALAAGMFLYISLVDMLPEATGMQVTISATSRRDTIKNFLLVNFAIIFGYSLMLILAVYSGNIKI